MVTLRTFDSDLEAGLAKARLDAAGIFCALADENAHLYGGGPLAMPIRLMVDENQLEQARAIMAEPVAPSHPAPEESEEGPELPPPENEVLTGIRSLQSSTTWLLLLAIATLGIAVYLLSELPRRTSSLWTPVYQARRAHDYDAAIAMSKRIIAKQPNEYAGHEYLGDIFFDAGRVKEAEIEYARALELAPPQSLAEKLARARKRLEEASPIPSATPF